MSEKRVEVCEMKVSDIKTEFGNPRKISKKGRAELAKSLEDLEDFGIFVIDDHNNVICGNQRLSILKEKDPDTVVLCKRLIGYTESELRAVNIQDNIHKGEWVLDELASWTGDIGLDLGVGLDNGNPEDRKEPQDMELIHYEKYDYVIIACRNEIDYNDLVRKLGIEDKKVPITNKRKIKCRAIWYDQMKAQLIRKED